MPVITPPRGPAGATFNGGTTGALDVRVNSNSALVVNNAANTQRFMAVDTVSGAFGFVATPATGDSALNLSTTSLTFKDELGNTVLDIEGGYVSLGATGAVFVTPNSYLAVSNHSAPADAELNAGDCALWFDQTNGAAKLMVKAKQADGSVKTAAIALT